MGKFVKKVGQKYRVMNDETTFKGGEIVELVKIFDNIKISYYENEKGRGGLLFDIDHENCEVELVETTFTKDDLKVGYLVELRNGQLAHVVPSLVYDLVLNFEDNWDTLSVYNDDLTSRSMDKYDIVKVYGLTKRGFDAHKFTTKGRELLWERKETKEMTIEDIETKEMTIEDIERELGYPVKVVK